MRIASSGGTEYRRSAERLGRSARESVPGNASGDALSGSSLDSSGDRTGGTVLDARQPVHDRGQRRPEEKPRGATRANQRRSRGRPGGGGALPSGPVEAVLHPVQPAATSGGGGDHSGDR